MSKIITNRTIAAAAFGAAALFSMMSLGSTAQASSVLNCHGATAGQAASCCEQMVEEKGMPLWMMQAGTSCNKAVVCHGGRLTIGAKSLNRCYIRVVEIVKKNGFEHGRSKAK
jgi:hypothetical protein